MQMYPVVSEDLLSPNSKGEGGLELRVATLNCWAIPFIWPLGSKDRKLRLERLADQLLRDKYDVVGLQELWSEHDYNNLMERVSSWFSYSHYFHSGFTGSGVAVLSRHPIVSTLTNRYSLNGFAHHIHRGDWFGGKVVGLVELEVKDMRIHFYSTHLHAEYNRSNDLYLPHRVSQAFELSQFIRHTSRGADFVILTGDFNLEPNDLGYKIILSNAHLLDAWRILHGDDCSPEVLWDGMTSDRSDNSYTHSILEQEEGKRLDYIMYKNGRMNASLLECETVFKQIPGEDKCFSDHCGVYARFAIDTTQRQESYSYGHEKALLNEAIVIVGEGEKRAYWDRKLFIAMFFTLILVIIGSLALDEVFFSVTPLFSIFRFLLTFIAAFFVWYGCLGLTMELKALKGAKQSMQKLLND